MNNRSTIALIIALILSGAAAMIAKNWIDEQQASNKPNPTDSKIETVQVYVAASKITYASRIENMQIKLIPWPKEALPEEAFTEEDVKKNPNAIIGNIAQREFSTNEVLLKPQIKEHLVGRSLSVLIKPGQRAYSVRVDDVAGVAGFILPGNKTDIIITGKGNTDISAGDTVTNKQDVTIACQDKSPGYMYITKTSTGLPRETYTLLSNINILANDQTTTQEQDKPIVARTLTLEVTQAQSECLSEATRVGSLMFTLRNNEDSFNDERKPDEQVPTPHKPEPIKAAPITLKVLPWSSQEFQMCEVGVSC